MEFNIEETICFTGHRPNKLYGYDKDTEYNIVIREKLNQAITYLYNEYEVFNFISGMAQGTDNWAAEEVIKLRESYPEIKLISAIPCKGFYDEKSYESQDEYQNILDNADYIHYVSNRNFFANCLQRRNEWMVDNSIGQIAVWDGTKGGTKNCIDYANKVDKKRRIIINPITFNIKLNGL